MSDSLKGEGEPSTFSPRKKARKIKEDHNWTSVREWLEGELALSKTPRQADIIDYAKRQLGVSARKTRKWLYQTFPSYYEASSRPTFPIPRKVTQTYLRAPIDTLSSDIAFFGKRNTELKNLGVSKVAFNGTLVSICPATRFLITVNLGAGGKSGKSLRKALATTFEKYEKQFPGYRVRTLLFDQEKSLMSKVVQEFLAEKRCKLFLYKHSRTKALFSENVIRNLRSSLSLLRHHKNMKKLTWHKQLDAIVESYNNRPLIIHGKRLSFTPASITPDNFHEFRQELRNKFEKFSFLSFSVDPALFKWKFPIGSRVRIKTRATTVPGLDAKLSENPIKQQIWIVKRRVVYPTLKNAFVKMVFLKAEDSREETQKEEQALVLVPPQSTDINGNPITDWTTVEGLDSEESDGAPSTKQSSDSEEDEEGEAEEERRVKRRRRRVRT